MRGLGKRIDFISKEWERLVNEFSKTTDKENKNSIANELKDLTNEFNDLIHIEAKLSLGGDN